MSIFLKDLNKDAKMDLDHEAEALKTIRDIRYDQFCATMDRFSKKLEEINNLPEDGDISDHLVDFVGLSCQLIKKYNSYNAVDALFPDAFNPRRVNRLVIERDYKTEKDIKDNHRANNVSRRFSRFSEMDTVGKGFSIEVRDSSNE